MQGQEGLDAYGGQIKRACRRAGISHNELAAETGITDLDGLLRRRRTPTMPELFTIAAATCSTVAELTGSPTVEDRIQHGPACRADQTATAQMRHALLQFALLDDYLNDYAIPT